MAIIDLDNPVSGIHGSINQGSEIYYAQRLGTTVVSHYPKHKDPQKITAHQRYLNNRFARAVTQASEILQDPQQRANYQELFNEQKEPRKYKTLRGFIIARLSKQQNNQLTTTD